MFHIHPYTTKPRTAAISEALTRDNRQAAAQLAHVRLPIQFVETVAVVCETLAGEVEVPFGQHLVIGDGEVYPITAEELEVRYIASDAGDE